MYSTTEQSANMHYLSRSEKHGPERVPAATLTLKYHSPNDVLSEFSPDLKASLYRRPHEGESDMADSADTRLDDPNYLPRLKFPNMTNVIQINKVIAGAAVTVHYGLRGKSDIVLDDCKVHGFKFDPQDGGTVIVTLNVDCSPSPEQAGYLHSLQDQEVTISISPPQDSQGQLIGDEE
ncbi:hypothetical protein RE432_15030 [Pusillimonas sp. SM2304]|uniref:hypothetical protein n=1 Tax=Pusillimonas sp. SM2304 TaxID=3073241 RepID=UPI002876975B|nr:hypothetical protein [Pusillimonas sp. SM2304]MDS1141753.1 hypothetical protein [Pusillimonas sp. SM2304]